MSESEQSSIFYAYDSNESYSSALSYEEYLLSQVCVTRSQYVLRMVVFALFISIGVIGNVSLLVVTLSDRGLRNAPNILICNLAASDLIFIIVTGPIRIEHEINPCWLSGWLTCALKNYAPVVCQCACVYSLVALSRERYTAITQGIHSRLGSQIKRTIFWVTFTWLFGVIFASPILSNKFSYIYIGILCMYVEHGSIAAKVYEAVKVMVLYVFPVAAISVHYSIMAKTLIQSTKKFKDNNASFTKQIESRKRLAYLSITLSICFGIFWLPSYIYTLMYNFMSLEALKRDYVTKFRHFHYYMSLANSSLNPWLVFALSSSHRKRLLKCRKVGENGTPRSSGSHNVTLHSRVTTVNHIGKSEQPEKDNLL